MAQLGPPVSPSSKVLSFATVTIGVKLSAALPTPAQGQKREVPTLSKTGPDRYGANIKRMVVPKGKTQWLAYINEFVEEAKASGAVQQYIERGGTRGVTVAPLGNTN
jgi:ABC-type amino acid transport substrate-binding protein